jgi:hypothetical protein
MFLYLETLKIKNGHNLRTQKLNVVNDRLEYLLRILAIPHSNLGPVTGCADWCLKFFLIPSMHGQFLARRFQHIIDKSLYHRLYTPSAVGKASLNKGGKEEDQHKIR